MPCTVVVIDFFEDLRELLLTQLNKDGFKVRAADRSDVARVCNYYFNTELRLISATPRRVLWSKELRERKLSSEQRVGLRRLNYRLTKGQDVTAYLSAERRANYNDMSLNDWGMHHLHLGALKAGKKSVMRTKAVLFAYVLPDVAYLVQLFDHDFADFDAVKILFANWPHLNDGPKLAIPPTETPPNRADVLAARKAGVLVIQQVDGGTFLGPGDGYVSDGLSWEAGRRADRLVRRVYEFQQRARMLGEPAADAVVKKLGMRPGAVTIRLQMAENKLWAVEMQTGTPLAVG